MWMIESAKSSLSTNPFGKQPSFLHNQFWGGWGGAGGEAGTYRLREMKDITPPNAMCGLCLELQ